MTMNSETGMKEISESRETEGAEKASMAIWDCGSPLYDSYELVSLSHLIERHLLALPSLGGSKRLTTRFHYPCDASSNVNSITHAKASSSSAINSLSDINMGRKLMKRRIEVEEEEIEKHRRSGRLCGICGVFGFSKK